jgi:nucleoside-diphosphate-sugar epimerase
MENISIDNPKETILLTGASGFIGSNLLSVIKEKYHIYAFARRTQKEIGIPLHKNITWILIDITDKKQLYKIFRKIRDKQKIDYVIHLAAYYDFGDQIDNDVYQNTNVNATKYILELTKESSVKHFIFSSSLVASKFPKAGDLVYENSDLDADYPYAKTKIIGENLVNEYSKYFKCTIVRFAAVYSDWCEYEPLYNFMNIWLSRNWKSRFIAGTGKMAIPYIHLNCIIDILRKIIEKTDDLNRLNIFLASSDKPASLIDLFTISTQLHYGEQKDPIFIPKFLAKLWIVLSNLIGRLIAKRPFERYWMTQYIDKIFPSDCSFTRETLGWEPKNRHLLINRMPYLIENLKSMPDDWNRKNLIRLKRFTVQRPSLILAEEMHYSHELIVSEIFNELTSEKNSNKFKYYQNLSSERLMWYNNVFYNNLLTSVRHGDRSIMISFGRDLAKTRFKEGVSVIELCDALKVVKNVLLRNLYNNPRLKSIKLLINDNITLAIKLATDEIKDTYDILTS